MLTVQHEKRTISVEYDGSKSLLDFKKHVCGLLSLPAQTTHLYFNNLHLQDDHKPIKDLFPDNSTITAIIGQPNLIESSLPQFSNMLQNKDFLKSIMNSNDQMKEYMENNPQLKQMMEDGSLYEEFQEIMKDPKLYQQALKSADLQMARAHNIPGGTAKLSEIMNIPSFNTTKNVNEGYSLTDPSLLTPLGVFQENAFIKYSSEIKKLREYGFTNTDDVVRALKLCNGDCEEAALMLAESQGE